MSLSLQQKINKTSNDYSEVGREFKKKTRLDFVSGKYQNYDNIKCDEFMSVVISYYEGKETLPLMLTRLEKQNYKNFEVIIIDDGSPTDVLPKIKRLKTNLKIKFIRQLQNKGRSFTRNTGILMSKGQSIIFTDQDVIFSKDFVKKFAIRQNYTKKCVFLGFKEDIDLDKLTINKKPKIKSDWRFSIKGSNDFIPIHNKKLDIEKKDRIYHLLDETANLKTFGFGKVLGFWDLPATVISHGLCVKKDQAIKTGGFPERGFLGWGAQDIAFGALL